MQNRFRFHHRRQSGSKTDKYGFPIAAVMTGQMLHGFSLRAFQPWGVRYVQIRPTDGVIRVSIAHNGSDRGAIGAVPGKQSASPSRLRKRMILTQSDNLGPRHHDSGSVGCTNRIELLKLYNLIATKTAQLLKIG